MLVNRRLWRAVSAVVLTGTPVKLLAEGDAFAMQQSPVAHYGSRVLAVVLVLGFVTSLSSLLWFRHKLSSTISWGFLGLGLAAFPLLTSGFGTVLVFERAQSVEFCESCHRAMGAFVADMKNPDSHSLAAIHYTNRYIPDNQCYGCHTNYGIFGDLRANREGLQNVFTYYTHAFRGTVKLRRPYSNHDCLKCHAGAAKWLNAHAGKTDDLLSDKISCLECHSQQTPAHVVQ
jgi:cytochrome c nitrite reductase small subunit